jgi:lipopolysaccharide/colanic/teichoic acid biosynthesis glycosyltransferase
MAISRTGQDEFMEKRLDSKGIATPRASAHQELWQELEIVVRKHTRYLYEVERMGEVRLPKPYLLAKRAMDIAVGTIGLAMLSPLFLVVMIMIKIDSRGPVFFSQDRVGKGSKLFKMYKFRTMVTDAEDKTGPVWAVENDPRLTFIGRILRNSKIDEFPQFVNLVKGDMTMVGPRPERPFFVDYFSKKIPGYVRRLEVTPGITGLAQLRNGYDRDAMDVFRKLRFDITYVKKMKLGLDLRLLWDTFLAMLTGKF